MEQNNKDIPISTMENEIAELRRHFNGECDITIRFVNLQGGRSYYQIISCIALDVAKLVEDNKPGHIGTDDEDGETGAPIDIPDKLKVTDIKNNIPICIG